MAKRTIKALSELDFMWPKEVAHLFGMSEAALANKRSRGTGGPAWYKFGGKVRYDRADVERYIESCRREVA